MRRIAGIALALSLVAGPVHAQSDQVSASPGASPGPSASPAMCRDFVRVQLWEPVLHLRDRVPDFTLGEYTAAIATVNDAFHLLFDGAPIEVLTLPCMDPLRTAFNSLILVQHAAVAACLDVWTCRLSDVADDLQAALAAADASIAVAREAMGL